MSIEIDYRRILRMKRKRLKLTQQEAADKIGISRSYLSDIENGKSLPSGKTLFAINEVIPIFLPFNDDNNIHFGEVKQNV
ncbi:helix-turn-helix domain-containing protein [Salinicoccus sp. Marseille-QA3877]